MITGVHEAVSETVSDVVSDAVSDVHEAVRKAQSRREQLREQTDHKIMKATLAIVISDGVGAVTIEEVARRSGVAKTTIYRRYKNADDLPRAVGSCGIAGFQRCRVVEKRSADDTATHSGLFFRQ